MATEKTQRGGARPGAGRKPAPENPSYLQIPVKREVKARYVAAAQARGENLSEFVRAACDQLAAKTEK